MATRQITAQIPAAYYETVVTMFKGLGISYTESGHKAKSAPEPDTKEYVLDSICRGMQEVRLWEQGKLQLKSAEELLNEL
ncbi:MAG: hypothetical protein IJ760_06820 [Bacteroidales bacterium]|nr:hypothetical protein [Bacteroidales bacterium]